MTDDHQPVTSNSGPSDPERRGVLAGLLTAYSASLIPWALAQPVSTAAQGAFIAVSAMLVGRRSLDAGLAARLYGALAAESPQFAPDVGHRCHSPSGLRHEGRRRLSRVGILAEFPE